MSSPMPESAFAEPILIAAWPAQLVRPAPHGHPDMDGTPTLQRPPRLVSLDAYRGLIMLFMASGGLGLAQVAKQHPDSRAWQWLAYHTSHAAWVGGGAWDMIQPSFMFMVGMAVPFSLARRASEGQTATIRLLHAVWRAAVLVALGVFLASNGKKQPEYIFVNVLAQIGLGYVFLVALAGRGWKVQSAAMAAIAAASWAAFAWHPLPGPEVDLAGLGVTAELAREAVLPGFFAHWNMNTNVAADFDRWFLNLFPRETPFVFNAGGYQTLNCIPSLITMILGTYGVVWQNLVVLAVLWLWCWWLHRRGIFLRI